MFNSWTKRSPMNASYRQIFTSICVSPFKLQWLFLAISTINIPIQTRGPKVSRDKKNDVFAENVMNICQEISSGVDFEIISDVHIKFEKCKIFESVLMQTFIKVSHWYILNHKNSLFSLNVDTSHIYKHSTSFYRHKWHKVKIIIFIKKIINIFKFINKFVVNENYSKMFQRVMISVRRFFK